MHERWQGDKAAETIKELAELTLLIREAGHDIVSFFRFGEWITAAERLPGLLANARTDVAPVMPSILKVTHGKEIVRCAACAAPTAFQLVLILAEKTEGLLALLPDMRNREFSSEMFGAIPLDRTEWTSLIAAVEREALDAMNLFDDPNSREVSKVRESGTGKPRTRATKSETQGKVFHAITYKIKNPNATEKDCAKEAKISQSTLNGNLEWKKWQPKIERASMSGKMQELEIHWGEHSGDHLISDTTDS